ncbi:putative methyltransferase, putative O-methyltransferase [Chlamydiales bacterium STE3]|nr:putative methyltransferase, putative O-methyltransferase [Chlamydiales bacterium STE3]
MKKKFQFILFAFLTFCNLQATLPEPYASIHVLPFDGHGWFGNQEPLKNILHAGSINTVIEVGSWLGSSTRFIASELPEDGVVYAVDTWLGTPEEVLHCTDPRLPYLYQQFLSNVIHAGLTKKIVPIRMHSQEAANALHLKAGLIYLDASHETENVYKDILAWYPHLAEGGMMCGDDWLWPTVQVAVMNASQVLQRKVHSVENFWWFE